MLPAVLGHEGSEVLIIPNGLRVAAFGNRNCCNLPVFSDQFKQKPGVCEAVMAAGIERST